MATRAPPDSQRTYRGKRGFAKRAFGFAKRASGLPGFPYLWLVSFAVVVLMVVTGGFGTGALPLPRRIAFWSLLLGWSALKWQIWFALTVRHNRDWMRAALIGCVLLNLPLPIEIATAAGAIGEVAAGSPVDVWLRALAISIAIFPVMWAVSWQLRRWSPPVPDAAPPPPGGLLDRAKVAPAALLAIEAEDHYCRVRQAGGGNALIHYRFGDALGEVAALEGLQVHRGAWVAAGAVRSAAREGRRWVLTLTDGSKITISATHLPAVRAKGWLAR